MYFFKTLKYCFLLTFSCSIFIANAQPNIEKGKPDLKIGVKNYMLLTWGGHFQKMKPVAYKGQNKILKHSPEVFISLEGRNGTKHYLGVRYFSRSIDYDPFFYSNQKVRINHTVLTFPYNLGFKMNGSNEFRHYLNFGIAGGTLIKNNVQLYINDELEREGENFLFEARNDFIVDVQLEYEFYYKIKDNLELNASLFLGQTWSQVIYSDMITRGRYMGISIGFNYSNNEHTR